MDHGGKALIRLVASHGNAFEFLQLAEEVLDQVPPFVDLLVDDEWRLALRLLRDDDLGAALVQLVDDPVRVEGLISDQSCELDALNERREADGVVAMSW